MQSTNDRINLHTCIDCTRRFSYVHKCKFLDLYLLIHSHTHTYGFSSLVFAVVVIVVTAVVVAVVTVAAVAHSLLYMFHQFCVNLFVWSQSLISAH